jgi:hypothetical protein
MKNITKYLLVSLFALSFSIAQAGELSVTGSAKASYAITSSDGAAAAVESGKGLGITNEFTFGASGENDFGTWAYATDFDGGTLLDDAKLTLTNDMGTFGIFVSEGGLDTDNAASQSVVSRPSDTSFDEGMFDSFDLSGSNTIQYHTPAGLLPFGVALKVAYAPSNSSTAQGSATAALADFKATPGANTGSFTANTSTTIAQTAQMGTSATHYQVTAAPIQGLTIGADYVDFDGVVAATAQSPESGSVYAVYAMGPAKIGYSRNYASFAIGAQTAGAGTDLIESVKGTKYSLGLNVNDSMSISYEHEESVPNNQAAATVKPTITSKGVQAAYTVGGMTLAVAMNDHTNASYTQDKNVQDTVLTIAMAF